MFALTKSVAHKTVPAMGPSATPAARLDQRSDD
jgi:hypothetical protein